MLGAIIGDIVGSRFEFNNTNRTDFELFTDECGFTDDTICTIAVADAILSGTDFGKTLHYWCRKYPMPMGGYGRSFLQWVRDDVLIPYNSFGNGSAMRVSPCGWLPERQKALQNARFSAECTHNHPEGIKGAECIADFIFLARQGYDKVLLKENIQTTYGYNLNQTCDYIRRTNTFNETCQVTVPQAIICFLESADFESAIRLAVSIGGDSDTIATITGSIAEAYYGIPKEIEEKALMYLPNEFIEIITKFREKYGQKAI
ncbi:hypothetical protein CAPN001_11290 [Capnocytophaga stomatis]|uniref:ADP-ribosylglycohydrolase family protein n=1 Tax=Capnocytophaga stomatis TaxID=1848904 RepID=UPI001950F77C|nr:ADP-ribosylglycohydrolase family protein [Capnocytophaga stomatis]GIJ96560.1 hypothetical protein CAPN001_11290 [Capnocytophaga stomatis]